MRNDAIKALYEMIRSNREYALLQREPEYRRTAEETDRTLAVLQADLTPEQEALLEQYLCAKDLSDEAVSRVLFTCGVSVGLELAFCTLP